MDSVNIEEGPVVQRELSLRRMKVKKSQVRKEILVETHIGLLLTIMYRFLNFF